MVEARALTWRRPPASDRIVLLLGAFDPPTNAHVEILAATASDEAREPAWGMTKVLLDRPAGGLFSFDERVEIVAAIAERTDSAFGLFEHGTYLDVHRTLRNAGVDTLFLIGSDKLAQLRDPSFYTDGTDGVEATFAELRFHVIERPDDSLSATRVRRLVADGKDVTALVPPEVTRRLGQGLR